jgi:hypothetical protein
VLVKKGTFVAGVIRILSQRLFKMKLYFIDSRNKPKKVTIVPL